MNLMVRNSLKIFLSEPTLEDKLRISLIKEKFSQLKDRFLRFSDRLSNNQLY